MTDPRSPKFRAVSTEWLRRADRVAADLNIFLTVFAIGVATLDVTCLFSQRIIDHLPPLTQVVSVQQPAAPPLPPGQSRLP
jgi:hypothetical protein